MPRPARSSGRLPVRLSLVAFIALAGLTCKGTTSIKTLLDDPSRFDGKTVRIVGEVQRSVGALGFGAYELSDGTGTLPVVSQGGGAPREGAKVGVEGTFRSAYTFGNQSGAVLVEQRRYTP